MAKPKNITVDRYAVENRFPVSTYQIIYNPSKHYLGLLCARNHEYRNSGKTVRGLIHDNCMICMRMNAFVWRHENLERARKIGRIYEAARGKIKSREAQLKWRQKLRNRLRVFCWGARNRAQASGVPFNLTIDGLLEKLKQQDGRCYWLGIRFTFVGPPKHPLKPSLDRLEPEKGYVLENVVWATQFANRARSDTPADEFRRILDLIRPHI